ncbi:MAG TPA: hypothetical protein VFD46_09430 [Chryseolinea sp.]|nr:hypothetical protein [Chryseolinea sp.]
MKFGVTASKSYKHSGDSTQPTASCPNVELQNLEPQTLNFEPRTKKEEWPIDSLNRLIPANPSIFSILTN